MLEDDKVPNPGDIDELERCPCAWCGFPYPVSFYNHTTMKDWTYAFPFTLGFVKFSFAVQQSVSVEQWYCRTTDWGGLDRRIEEPIMQQFGPMHLHPRFIKHNHLPTLEQRITWGLRGH